MIKLIIFDLDGVLCDCKEMHYNALNEALPEEYKISYKDHLLSYDGLPTQKKLELLRDKKNLPREFFDAVYRKKQAITEEYINKYERDDRLCGVLKRLHDDGFILGCCTNSIRHTGKLQLIRKGFFDYIDFFLSNEDVRRPKPHPEIYLKCMIFAGYGPDETMIIEDSYVGRLGAVRSGAKLLEVKDSRDVTYEKIKEFMKNLKKIPNGLKWKDSQLNVLIPMAGAGSRFEKAGYTFPKPLIDVNGKPMIQVVVENLNIDANYIFIVQKSHYEKYNLNSVLNLISPNCKIVQVEGLTEGAACTTLLAKEYVDNDNPLLIANSDQFVEWNSGEFLYSMQPEIIDAGIVTFENTHPKWSYAKVEDGYVTEVAEKNPISNCATVGIYYWRKGSDYVKYAERMIHKNVRVNNEFYVCPVFNEAIADGKKIKTYHIDKMFGLGTPEDLKTFESRHG